MSSIKNTISTPSVSEALFDAALSMYKKRTGQDLCSHPLAAAINRCGSPDSILAIFQEQARAFDEFRNGDPKLIKWLAPVVNKLHSISETTSAAALGTSASYVSPTEPNSVLLLLNYYTVTVT